MPLTLDFSADPAAIWDSPETITYHAPAGTAQAGQSIEINTAIRQQLSQREVVQSGGFYVGQDCHWFLAGAAFLGAMTPRVGGRIVRRLDGSEWTILDLSFEDLDQVWESTCRNFALVNDLADTITILTPLSRRDTALGRVIDAWLPKQTGVPARIQEVSAAPAEERGRRVVVREYQVFVGRRVTMTHEDLIEDAAGKRYEFLRSESPDRIDQLQVITVRRTEDQLP